MQIYTGNGKGKTTAALGLCVRALGAGKRVCLVQFLKKGNFSELEALRRFENFTVRQFGIGEFVDPKNVSIQHKEGVQRGLAFAKEALLLVQYDLLVLDEILVALQFKLLQLEDIRNLVAAKPAGLELVLTGRGAPKKLLEKADYVSKIVSVRHPFQKGIKARRGIEY